MLARFVLWPSVRQSVTLQYGKLILYRTAVHIIMRLVNNDEWYPGDSITITKIFVKMR